jgi:hypothetical protein
VEHGRPACLRKPRALAAKRPALAAEANVWPTEHLWEHKQGTPVCKMVNAKP